MLLTETLRLLRRFLPLLAVIAVVCGIAHVALGNAKAWPVMVTRFYPLAFFVAPVASASVRARRSIRLFSPTGIRTLLFCSVWGALGVIAFVATRQRWQGMGASTLDHAVADMSAAAFC